MIKESFADQFKNISILKVTSLDDIKSIKGDWNYLHNSFSFRNIYTYPDFFISTFNSRALSSSTPNIVLFKKNNKPIAIIVGWINPKYVVTSWLGYLKIKSPNLKCFEVENNGIISDGNSETDELICEYLKNQIRNTKIDLFAFNHLSSQNPIWDKIISKKCIYKNPVYKKSVNWITTLRDAQTGERKKIHSKKTNSKLFRKARKFRQSFDNQLVIRPFNNINSVQEFLENADLVTKNSYQYSINVGIRNNEYWKNIITSLAKGKYLRAYILFVKDKPVAYIIGAQYSDILFLIATSFNYNYSEYSPGEFLRHELIEDFLQIGIDIIDYGYGDAIYKQRCGTEAIEEASVRIYGNGFKANLAKFIDGILTQSGSKFLELLRGIGLLDKIKGIWRQRLVSRTVL